MYTLCKDCCFCTKRLFLYLIRLCFCRQENVAELLKNMFEGERTEASVVNGTQVLLTLLESRRSGWVHPLQGLINTNINSHAWTLAVLPHLIFLWPSVISVSDVVRLEGLMELYSQGCERSYTVNSSILRAIEPHLKDFQQLLLNPPTVPALNTHSHATPSGRKCHLRAFLCDKLKIVALFPNLSYLAVCITKVKPH